MPYENSEENLGKTFISSDERARILLPIFAYPTLFRMRFKLPSDYDFTYFSDKSGIEFKVNSTPDGSFVMPENPFSLLDKTEVLTAQGWKRQLKDFTKTKVPKGTIKDVLNLIQTRSIAQDSCRFNWKDGFYNGEKVEEYKASAERAAAARAAEKGARGERSRYGKQGRAGAYSERGAKGRSAQGRYAARKPASRGGGRGRR